MAGGDFMVVQQDLFGAMAATAQVDEAAAPIDDTAGADAAAGIADAAGAADFWAHVAVRLAAFDLPAAMLDYARELARFEEGLTSLQQRALAILILATIIEVHRGSTRVWVGNLLPRADGNLQEDGGQRAPNSSGIPQRVEGVLDLVCALTEAAPDLLPPRPNTMHGTVHQQETQALTGAIRWLLTPGNAPTIVGRPGDYRPLILDQDHLYHQRIFFYENALVDALAARLKRTHVAPDLASMKTALEDVLAQMPAGTDGQRPMDLSGEQQYALLLAAARPVSVISGGPGTGKTSIVVSLLRLLVRLGLKPDEIALAAPTGKAAHRLSASVQAQLSGLKILPGAQALRAADQDILDTLEPARTLHRLLGYSPARNDYYYHAHHRLPYQVVIVDEASMIDLFLMERLLNAVAPQARLVLLGDADQLPSVETGAVFRDLLPAQVTLDHRLRALVTPRLDEPEGMQSAGGTAPGALRHHAMRLQKSYRMDPRSSEGADILRAARALNAGEAPTDFTQHTNPIQVRQDFSHVLHAGVELCEPVDESDEASRALLNGFVPWWYHHLLGNTDVFGALLAAPFAFDGERFTPEAAARLKKIGECFQRAQALSATRVFRTGSGSLNAAFHARHLGFLDGLRERGVLRHRAADFAIGEPVLMLKNDYQRGLFNGDHGIIAPVQRTTSHASDVEIMAVFPRDGHLIPFSLNTLAGQLEHAYALTIHKAQGSEYEQVAIVLPGEPLPLLTRELLYTGMTRSRRSVVLVGARAHLVTSAQRAAWRDSGIAQKLAARAPLNA